MKLTPPNSWAERKARELQDRLATIDDKAYRYLGCCLELTEEDIRGVLGGEIEWPRSDEYRLQCFRDSCSGLHDWADIMGYVQNTAEGLVLDNDWHLQFHLGSFNGGACAWITHSSIEYIWVHASVYEQCKQRIIPVRLDPQRDTSALTPAEKVRLRAQAKHVDFSFGAPKKFHGAPPVPLIDEALIGKVVPLAITIQDFEQYGCPYCAYKDTGWKIGEIGDRAFVSACRQCGHSTHILCGQATRSPIGPFRPWLVPHPQKS